MSGPSSSFDDANQQASAPSGSPLDEVVDDLSPREECRQWLHEQLSADRAPEELETELLGNGWSTDDAAELVEQARQQTRRERGVVTRDDVVRQANQHYRQSMGGWMSGLPTLSSARRLLYAFANLSIFKRKQ